MLLQASAKKMQTVYHSRNSYKNDSKANGSTDKRKMSEHFSSQQYATFDPSSIDFSGIRPEPNNLIDEVDVKGFLARTGPITLPTQDLLSDLNNTCLLNQQMQCDSGMKILEEKV